MTLTEAVAAVRLKILERASDTGFVTDDDIKAFVKEANRTVWKKAMLANDAMFVSRSGELAVAGGAIPLATLNANVTQIAYLEVKGSDGKFYPVWPVEGGAGDRFQPETGAITCTGSFLPDGWYVEGDTIRFTPLPPGALTIRAVYVPAVADPIDAGQLLGGRYLVHHDAVTTKAAILCYCRDESKNTPWDGEYRDLLELLTLDVQRGGNAMRSRRASPRDPFNA